MSIRSKFNILVSIDRIIIFNKLFMNQDIKRISEAQAVKQTIKILLIAMAALTSYDDDII